MTMGKAISDVLKIKHSMMAGVGDDELTKEEEAAAIYIGHQQPEDIYKIIADELIPPANTPEIASTVGVYREFKYKMDKKQETYCIDEEWIQTKFDNIYMQDKEGNLDGGHGMVVASSASLKATGDMLADIPTPGERIVFYVCGGGFISSDIPLLRWHYLRISAETGQRVFVPQYNVAPGHVFPRALHDTYTAYLHLLGRGFCAEDITMVALSAGGNIGMGMLRLLEMHHKPQPAKVVLIAPCLDLTFSSDSWQRNQKVCVLPYHPLESPRSMSRMYLGPVDKNTEIAKVLSHPLLSPLFADCAELPPIQLHIGQNDVFVDEAIELAKRIEESHGKESRHVELITYPGKNHYTILRGKTQLNKVYDSMRQFIDSLPVKKIS
ncbi:alpha/beta-hydrolase [Coemansia reversa NRRL 1564]|uniref:Alpha/beta-hydrolase n=1 Tax=Coemansia reversa (strain ATCC 12441 / NRRL 1564) TaxID=763665 RepID=A0A2G5B9Q2_COERN|nr:alpha/beta-hydrolase [Coemansia reversa NRRL 1564]|eukprot:PIA15749.1 alpha/beta-hydrolase [Coemansia reversa NRRL 1564]